MATVVGPPRMYENKREHDVRILGEIIVTTVTESPAAVDSWIEAVTNDNNLPRPIVGFEAQLGIFPSFLPIPDYNSTLQLCVGGRCLLYRVLNGIEVAPSLFNFFEDPNKVFVGVGISTSLMQLGVRFNIGGNAAFVDLEDLAVVRYDRPALKNASLRELTKLVLGKVLEKPREGY